MSDRRAVAVFLAGAFVWSWGLLALFSSLGGTSSSKSFFAVLLPYMMGPGVSALATQYFLVRRPVPAAVGLTMERSTWVMAAWFLPPVIALAVLGLESMWPGLRVSFVPSELLARDLAIIPPEHLEEARKQAEATSPAVVFFSQFSGAMFFGTLLLGFTATWQELGWRGFLVKALAALGFWRMSALVGLISALWYAPFAAFSGVYGERPVMGAVVMGAFVFLSSPVACWLRLRAGSVVAASVFVGGLQSFSRLVDFFTIGGDQITRGLFTVPGVVVMAALAGALWVRTAPGAEASLQRLAQRDL